MPNAYPITTQKEYVPHRRNSSLGNWEESDFEEFKKVIDEDFEHIKKADAFTIYFFISFWYPRNLSELC